MTPKDEKLLIKMWKAGKTGLQIAEKIGTTRNAVMGKLKRLRDKGLIEYKTVPVKREDEKNFKIRGNLLFLPIRNRRIIREIKSGKRDAPQVFVSPEAKNLRKPPVRFADLTSRSCKFVINDGNPKDFLFCGDDRKDGSSYCERHHKMCYVAGTSDQERNRIRKRKKLGRK
jgi:hypothetical protein